MALTEKQRHQLKKMIKELESYRGRHTELVTVYIPEGYEITKIINHLSQEQGTASNIKSTSTRKNVQDALERMIQHLRLFKETPAHGLAAFSGNVAEREGQSDVKVWSIEPPVPLNIRIYRCDKQFLLEPLLDMLDIKEAYGLIVIDRRDGDLALLKGKSIIPLAKTHSEVPGKFKAGGQCLVKETLIQSHNGDIFQLKLSHNPKVLKSMVMKNFTLTNSPVTDRWDINKSQIYKITTKYPRLEVEASKDHIFFVRTNKGIEEKPAEELKKGDFLIMPEKIDIKGEIKTINSIQYYNSFSISKSGQELLISKRKEKKLLQKELAELINVKQTTISAYEIGKINARRETLQKVCAALDINFYEFLTGHTEPHLYKEIRLPPILTSELAQFLGYLIGDGSIEKDRITFFEQNKDVAMDYKNKFDKYLKIESSYKFRENKHYYQIRFTSRPLVRLIINEFPEIKKAKDTIIPKKVLESTDNILASFIKGIFDAEGYVSTRKCIGLGINNKILAQQLQMALLRFSIISSIHEYDNNKNKYSNNFRYTIDITEKRSLELFKKVIGFTSKSKLDKLNNSIDKTEKSNVRQILTSGKKIREIIEKADYNLELFPRVNSFFRNERMMGKETFKNSILSNIKDKKLKTKLEEIYNYPLLPVKINSIKITKKETEMVDISVGNKNFIANGVIVHNSAQRFERNRELSVVDHIKRVADLAKDNFLNKENLKGIIIGGPGPTKNKFVDGNYLTGQLKDKVIAIKDLSYTEDFGMEELVDKSQDVLANEDIAQEKKLMNDFFELLSTKPNQAAYGKEEVLNALKMGAVDKLLISDIVDDETIELFEKEAEKVNTEVFLISTETREGAQLKDIGKIAAILRYELNTD